MKTINYKGFDIWIEIVGNSFNILQVEASITNQIALLTKSLIDDNMIVEPYTIELGYSFKDESSNYVDLAIDIDKWYSTDVRERDRLLIELLMLEENEIMEQIGEVV